MRYHSRIILAAIATTTLLTATAVARSHRGAASPQTTQFCGDRVCPAFGATRQARAQRQPASRERVHVRTASHRRKSREATPEPRQAEQGGGTGVVRSSKTGVTAHVAAGVQARFQALTDDLEAHGATIYYMGGWRRGRCSLGSQHPCGWAIDFCQDYRGHVSGARDCHLPRPAEFHALVRAHGLYDGSVWCNSDYGHVQAKESGGCNVAAHGNWGSGRVRLASMTGTVQFEARHRRHRPHHHRIRYAHR